MNTDRTADHELLKTGTLVDFRVVDKSNELTPDKENVLMCIDLAFQADEDQEPSDVVEWAAHGFLFCLAVLSEFMEGLSFGRNGLRFYADYIRGRLLKTDITVRSDGTVTLTTWGRGEAALRWLDRLKGKKLMEVV